MSIIGPALPPHLRKAKNNEENDDNKNSTEDTKKANVIGPTLPSWMSKNKAQEDNNEESFGPALPPGFGKTSPKIENENPNDEDDGDCVIGPLPPDLKPKIDSTTTIAEEFEKRSQKMKNKITGNEEPEKLEREEWMTELPPVLQGFGMGPRTFRAKAPEIGDRSVWTETPSDKDKKKQKTDKSIVSGPQHVPTENDQRISEAVDKYNENVRSESLLSMHKEKLKRKRKEEGGKKKERREFDRDIDLQANRFDNAKKKRLIKQAQGLSSRFSKGNTSTSFL